MRFLKKIIILCKSSLWIFGILKGVAANIELLPFLNKVKNINTLIDIGSNKGQFILLCHKFFPNLIVYSFEPIKEILEGQKKFFSFKKKIFFFNFGIGNINKTSKFSITQRKDSSSFLTINKSQNYNKNYSIYERRNVKIKKLDGILKNKNLVNPILIKIDVQGYELEVLKGSKKILPRIDYLLLEVSKSRMYNYQPVEKEIINFLAKKNFKILKKGPWLKIYKTNFYQRDILFKRNHL